MLVLIIRRAIDIEVDDRHIAFSVHFVAITTRPKCERLPFCVRLEAGKGSGLKTTSYLNASHIHAFSKDRLLKKMGKLTSGEIAEMDVALRQMLADFTSVVDAVNCAVEIQRELAERNLDLPENHKMQFRIGVNLGDVIEDGGRIYGDGVNIAARVESLSEAGGICISGRAYDQVENKLGLAYDNLGEHQVKNITRPIRKYRVINQPSLIERFIFEEGATLPCPLHPRRYANPSGFNGL